MFFAEPPVITAARRKLRRRLEDLAHMKWPASWCRRITLPFLVSLNRFDTAFFVFILGTGASCVLGPRERKWSDIIVKYTTTSSHYSLFSLSPLLSSGSGSADFAGTDGKSAKSSLFVTFK